MEEAGIDIEEGVYVRSRAFVLAILFLELGCNRTAKDEGMYRGPLIAILDTDVNFGKVSIEGGRGRSKIISIANRGLGELRIDQIESGCSCTVPQISSARIPPGKSAQLTIMITNVGSGLRSSVVSIHSNDQSRPIVALKVNWEAVTAFGFDDFQMDFGDVDTTASPSRIVRLVSLEPEANRDCAILGWDCSHPDVDVRLPSSLPVAVKDGVEIGVNIRAGIEPGVHKASVKFKFSRCPEETRTLFVSWRVRTEMEFVPKGLVVKVPQNGQASAKFIIMTQLPVEAGKLQWHFEPPSFAPTLVSRNISPRRIEVSMTAACPPDREVYNCIAYVASPGKPEARGSIPISMKIEKE